MSNETAYVIGWISYLLAAAVLMAGYEWYVARHMAQAQWRVFIRAFMAISLFTPSVVVSGDVVYVAPACVGVMFNVLEHSFYGVLKALLPLFFVSFVVFITLYFYPSNNAEPKHEERRDPSITFND